MNRLERLGLIVLALSFAAAVGAQSTASLREQTNAIKSRWAAIEQAGVVARDAPSEYRQANEAVEKAAGGGRRHDKKDRVNWNYRAERTMDAAELAARINRLEGQIAKLRKSEMALQAAFDEMEAQRQAELDAARKRREQAELLAEAERRNAEVERIRAELAARDAALKTALAAEEVEAATQEAELSAAQAAEAASRAELAEREAAVTAAAAEIMVSKAAQEAAASQAEAALARKQAENLADLLSQAQSELELERTKRGAVFILGDVLFEVNGDRLLEGATRRLDKLTELLASHPAVTAVIEGHTDNTGSREYNLDLSHRRAQSVMRYLAGVGIAADRLQAVGLGMEFPRSSNDTPEGRQENRRVEIIMQDN